MLCLNRKIGQAIQINDDVTITLLSVKGGSARLGIEYGEKSRVLRHEVYVKVQHENREALASLKRSNTKLEMFTQVQDKKSATRS